MRKHTFFYSENFKHLIPDSFHCPYRCNTCKFNIEKHNSYGIITCRGCTMKDCRNLKYPDNEQLCFDNWIQSQYVIYNDLPDFINNCINGYRNFIYIKHIQQTVDINFSVSDSKTLEHTYIALEQGIHFSTNLHSLLIQKNRFKEEELFAFGIYMKTHNLYTLSIFPPGEAQPRVFRSKWAIKRKVLNSVCKIFDYLRINAQNINSKSLYITIKQFDLEYQGYKNQIPRW